jgi:uncharacterized membrane protein
MADGAGRRAVAITGTRSQRLLAAFFVLAGSMHFIRPAYYRAIMPPYVPYHREAVAVSGAAEIAGGLAVVPAATRRYAGWWLIALLSAVFPANLHMALHPDQIRGLDARRVRPWMLWARLPLQPLMMLWAWRATRSAR